MTNLVTHETALLELKTFLPYRLSLLSALTADALASIHAPHGLHHTEWIVLAAIAERPQTTAKNIGATFHMQKAKVSRAVAALIARKLIFRTPHPRDHRLGRLELTPKGQEVYEKCAPAAADFARRLEDSVAAPDREILRQCLLKLAQASEALMSGAAPSDHAAENASGAPPS